MTTVTVCVITRNQPDLVPLAVRSVYAQTYRDFELVIVDDCSDDGLTPAVVARLVQERPDDIPVRCICRAGRGWPAAARNTGYAAASSEFFLSLDGDDEIEPKFLERTTGAIGDAAVCFPDYRYIGDMDGIVETGPWDGLWERNTIAVTSLMRRTAFRAVGGYDSRAQWLTDYDLWRSMFWHGFEGVHLPEALFRYRRHTGQWTHAQEGRPAAEDAFRKKWAGRTKEMAHG